MSDKDGPRAGHVVLSDLMRLAAGFSMAVMAWTLFYLSLVEQYPGTDYYHTGLYVRGERVLDRVLTPTLLPSLGMLVGGLLYLAETVFGWDMSVQRVSLAWPAINSALMVVFGYDDLMVILFVNTVQTLGVFFLRVHLVQETGSKAVIAARLAAWVLVLVSFVPLWTHISREGVASGALTGMLAVHTTCFFAWMITRTVAIDTTENKHPLYYRLYLDRLLIANEFVMSAVIPWLVWEYFVRRLDPSRPARLTIPMQAPV